MTHEQIELEVNHIFESGANEIRVIELIERLLPKPVSVTDRLPTMGQVVILLNYQLYEAEMAIVNFDLLPKWATHWIELPKKPTQ